VVFFFFSGHRLDDASRMSTQGHPGSTRVGKSMIYVTNETKARLIGAFAGMRGDAKLNIARSSRPYQEGRRCHRAASR